MMTESSDEVRLTLRLPSALRDRIADATASTGRSINAEIVARLEISDDVENLLRNFELAKEKVLSAQRIETAYEQQISILREALEMERATNERLLQILGDKVGTGEAMPEPKKKG
jgi:ferritin-like metal-binding protein YciE